MSKPIGAALLCLAVCVGRAQAAGPDFAAVVQTFVDQQMARDPVGATALGVHTGDSALTDVSALGVATEIAQLHASLDQLGHVDPATLSPGQRDEREILMAQIGGQLLEDEHVQFWRHNPDGYVGFATSAVYSLIERNFAPQDERMRAVIAREDKIPDVFAQAKSNLTDMPAVWVETALEDVAGAIDFFGQDVPKAFAGVPDPAQQARLTAATAAVEAALKDFQAWLKAQQPNAHGSFAYGPDNYRRLMAADMIDLDPDQVLAAGRAQLQRDRAAFQAASRQVSPKDPGAALHVIEADHPDGAHLISTASDQLAALRAFIVAHKIIDLPGADFPDVKATPEFMRSSIFGAEDPPGPFETHATLAYYYITPADSAKPAAEQDQYLTYFNRSLLLNLSVHEVLPGHFVQYLYQRANPGWSLVRKMAHSYTATEGWAHYTEQMMVEQGLSDGDPKLHLAQLQDALLRDCRLVASVEMHLHGMSVADATRMMADSCFQPKQVAYKEARRGTADPGYFSYTLGKLMIQKLRDDMRAKDGAAFTLARFHDAFENAGTVPIKIIRREIMGTDGPLL